MIRQRVNLRRAPWALLTRSLAVVFALLLVYGGVLDALLALKAIGPDQIEKLSAYRTIFHWVAELHRSQFTTAIALIAGFGGLVVFLFFIFLSGQALPRPYFTRTTVDLPGDRGETLVRPRAVERIAEVAARGNGHVMGATGRLGDDELYVDVGLDDAATAVQALRDIRDRVAAGLADHQIPSMPVNVTLTGYDPTRRDSP